MESNVSPDTIQKEISVLKGDVIAIVPDPYLGMGEGGSVWSKNKREAAPRALPLDPPVC